MSGKAFYHTAGNEPVELEILGEEYENQRGVKVRDLGRKGKNKDDEDEVIVKGVAQSYDQRNGTFTIPGAKPPAKEGDAEADAAPVISAEEKEVVDNEAVKEQHARSASAKTAAGAKPETAPAKK